MTKLINSSSPNFGSVYVGGSKTEQITVENVGTERVTITGLSSNNSVFVPETITGNIYLMPAFPISSTLYFGEDGKVTDANGAYFTIGQGFGYFGTTNSSGILTVGVGGMAWVTVTSPTTAQDIPANSIFEIEWTSENISTVDLSYSTNGIDFTPIASDIPATDLSYTWITPSFVGDVTIKIESDTGETDTVIYVAIATPLVGDMLYSTATITDETIPINPTFLLSSISITDEVIV